MQQPLRATTLSELASSDQLLQLGPYIFSDRVFGDEELSSKIIVGHYLTVLYCQGTDASKH